MSFSVTKLYDIYLERSVSVALVFLYNKQYQIINIICRFFQKFHKQVEVIYIFRFICVLVLVYYILILLTDLCKSQENESFKDTLTRMDVFSLRLYILQVFAICVTIHSR